MIILIEGLKSNKKTEYAKKLSKKLGLKLYDFDKLKIEDENYFEGYLSLITNNDNCVVNSSWVSDYVNDIINETEKISTKEFAVLSNLIGIKGGFAMFFGSHENYFEDWYKEFDKDRFKDFEDFTKQAKVFERVMIDVQMYMPIITRGKHTDITNVKPEDVEVDNKKKGDEEFEEENEVIYSDKEE